MVDGPGRGQTLRDTSTWLEAAAIFLVSSAIGGLFFSVLYDIGRSDLPNHVKLVIESRTGPNQLGYSIYYPLLEFLSGGGDADALRTAAIAVLAASFGLRAAVTWLLLTLLNVGTAVRIVGTFAASVAAPITISACANPYLGNLSPTIWHNSTTILAAPFALLLFASTCWVLLRKDRSWGPQLLQVALVVLSGWTKPNYLIAMVPALLLWCLVVVALAGGGGRWRTFVDLWWRAAPTGVAAALVLLVQFLLTYGGDGLQIYGQRVTNLVAPFALWNEWSVRFGVNPPWAIFISILTPLVLTVVLWSVRRHRTPLSLAWLGVLVGLAEFSLLAEALQDGTVLFHGNWIWGAQLAMTVLFTVSVAAFLSEFRSLGWGKWIGLVLMAYQTLIGVRWLQTLLMGASPTTGTLLTCVA